MFKHTEEQQNKVDRPAGRAEHSPTLKPGSPLKCTLKWILSQILFIHTAQVVCVYFFFFIVKEQSSWNGRLVDSSGVSLFTSTQMASAVSHWFLLFNWQIKQRREQLVSTEGIRKAKQNNTMWQSVNDTLCRIVNCRQSIFSAQLSAAEGFSLPAYLFSTVCLYGKSFNKVSN